MTVETDFRAALAAHAALTTLVGTRIALSAVPQGVAYPLVTFVVEHAPEYSLNNTRMSDTCTVSVQCWGQTSDSASAVADAVVAALAADATAQARDCTLTARATAFDPDLELDAEQMSFEWWAP